MGKFVTSDILHIYATLTYRLHRIITVRFITDILELTMTPAPFPTHKHTNTSPRLIQLKRRMYHRSYPSIRLCPDPHLKLTIPTV